MAGRIREMLMFYRLMLSALMSLPALHAQSPAKPKPLKPTRVSPKSFRLGFGVEGEISDRAYLAQIGDDRLLLWDLDGDDKIVVGKDGLSFADGGFIVLLPATLLLPVGQMSLSIEEENRLIAKPLPLGLEGEAALIAQASLMTHIRLRAGLPPLTLEADACTACRSHCNYLFLNPPNQLSLSPHEELEGKSGYSPEGARAGRSSCVFPGEGIATALKWCATTLWHGVPLVHPGVTSFGVADFGGHVLVWPRHMTPLEKIFLHPADGAIDIPLEFGRAGELPNPVPGTSYAVGCGCPVFAILPAGFTEPLRKATLVDERGNVVAGTQSCPKSPANGEWPTNSGAAAFIPSAPLRPGVRYQVKFEFASTVYSWSFRTTRRRD